LRSGSLRRRLKEARELARGGQRRGRGVDGMRCPVRCLENTGRVGAGDNWLDGRRWVRRHVSTGRLEHSGKFSCFGGRGLLLDNSRDGGRRGGRRFLGRGFFRRGFFRLNQKQAGEFAVIGGIRHCGRRFHATCGRRRNFQRSLKNPREFARIGGRLRDSGRRFHATRS
jgi:hypothetical protein